jgi:hypothetical protein
MDRRTPYAPLVPDWQQMFTFEITAATTVQDAATSPVIYGPFRLLELTHRCDTAGAALLWLRLGVEDIGSVPANFVASPSGEPQVNATDSTRTVAAFHTTNIVQRHTLNREFQYGTSRLVLMFNNTSAGTVIVLATATIVHLIPADIATERATG